MDSEDPAHTRTTFQTTNILRQERGLCYRFSQIHPPSKFFNETEVYIVNDTCYLEISFSEPSSQNSTAQASVPHPFS